MQFSAFYHLHAPALERDEARHNFLLALLAAIAAGQAPAGRWWSLGAPEIAPRSRAARRRFVAGRSGAI